MSFGLFLAFGIGCTIGSFLNVIAFRYNTGMSATQGRSVCFSCGKKLRWYELIPLLSYIALRGVCSKCKSRISLQYPVIELVTGLLFASTYAKIVSGSIGLSEVSDLTMTLLIFATLIVITIYDARHKIIPDAFVYAFMGLSIIRLVVMSIDKGFDISTFAHAFAGGPGVALPLFAIWLFSKGRWMGFGDVKLALGIGWFLGPLYGMSALVFGFWAGAIFGLSYMGYQRLVNAANKLKMKSEVPFGPFLIFGTLVAYFFSIDVLGIVTLFSR